MKVVLKKAWRGFLAAITSPTAVEQEKNLAVFLITRVLISVGASAGVVALVAKLIGAA